MIQAKELMVGNYLKTSDGIVVKIDALSIYHIWGSTKEYNPIPITEEWLFNFGFELINNDYWQSRNSELKLHWTVNKNKMIPEFSNQRLITGYDFKYIHHLQNLYYLLTGEEL